MVCEPAATGRRNKRYETSREAAACESPPRKWRVSLSYEDGSRLSEGQLRDLLQAPNPSLHIGNMTKPLTLRGKHVHLEPLERNHVEALAAAAAGGDPSLYRWSPVPQGTREAASYIETALAWRDAGTAVPFVIVRPTERTVIGSTRFWNLEQWAWPQSHPSHGRSAPDACEIGYTWFAPAAIRTAANTETKLLMLAHAFEVWKVLRVCFHTDVRNHRSRAALERIGARYEGILRAHRMAADHIPRDSVRYSIIAAEWPGVKQRLQTMADRV